MVDAFLFDRDTTTARLLYLLEQPWASRCGLLVATLGPEGSIILHKQSDTKVKRVNNGRVNADQVRCKMWSDLHVLVSRHIGISVCSSGITAADGSQYSMIR